MIAFPAFEPIESARHTVLSGIEMSQNILDQDVLSPDSLIYQTFHLPPDYQRGDLIPDITGFQFCIFSALVPPSDVILNVSFEINQTGSWVELAKGSIQGSPRFAEKVWINVYFDAPISIPEPWLSQQFRFGLQSTTSYMWASNSPVLVGETADIFGGNLAFRLLTYSGDAGTDFLGNRYRSIVQRSPVGSTLTDGSSDVDAFWYSKPNPSKYAVESLYFDVRDSNDLPSVVDRVLIDPITAGIYFNVYYSSEGDPATSEKEWEQKLWTPVAGSFRATKREEHALSEPIAAKYIQIEFTHLAASHYSPGTFHQPQIYKKHPKWVLDYYLARLNVQNDTNDPFTASTVRVIYDALKLGFDYYLDDLHQDPDQPNIVDNASTLSTFLSTSDTSDQIDSALLRQINLSMQPYLSQPGANTNGFDSVLAQVVQSNLLNAYSVESITPAVANTLIVSVPDRTAVIVEQNYPVMSFYLTCRHTYRELSAAFEHDRAYFAGVREIAFTRDVYSVASDQTMYIENLNDFTNVMQNDFIEDQYVDYTPNPAP